jgi:hypothetical protein
MTAMRIPLKIVIALCSSIFTLMFVSSVSQARQKDVKAAAAGSAGMTLRVSATASRAEALLDPLAAEWTRIPAQCVALNRTPRLYDTEAPSEPEIPFVDVRLARAEGKLLVNMTWHDPTHDAAEIARLPTAPTEGRPHKELTEATDRFSDAAAVMHPANPPVNGQWPSLQMGDPGNPVSIYFWSASRGAARMQAEGRGTTKRTGETFPAHAVYRDQAWHVTLELHDVTAGIPLAFAVWNGSQQDRDGRKYFTTWLKLE